jgi:hypothetical protein
MRRRIAGVVMAAGLQLVALVLAHEIVFLARYGSRYGEALVHAGHGGTWSAAVTTSIALGVVLAALAVARLVHLWLLVRQHPTIRGVTHRGASALPSGPWSVPRTWLRVGLRLAAMTVVLLTVQENAERGAFAGRALDPLLLLTPEYAGGLWITFAIGFTAGFVVALFSWPHSVLVARLRDARPRTPRCAAPAPRVRPHLERPIESLLGRRSALRAPPQLVAT